jgi:hypothetical protein
MDRATGDKVFVLEDVAGGGLAITGFRSAAALDEWLKKNAQASVNRQSTGSAGVFKIPEAIGGKKVVRIADKAFKPTPGNPDTDISSVVTKIELPSSIEELGEALFEGIEKKVDLIVPSEVREKVGNEAIAAAAGEDATAKDENDVEIPAETPTEPTEPSAPSEPSEPSGTPPSQPSNPSSPGTPGAGTYILSAYNASTNVATLNGTQYSITNSSLRTTLTAIYEPNSPTSTDDGGVAYTAEISRQVLGLFSITIGSGGSAEKVELQGTGLPASGTNGASSTNPIVIDIGIPGQTNSLKVYIPIQGLGDGSTSYGHIRLRVNSGAELVILADNGGYITNGVENPCPPGNFRGGCVEVMAGGKLRDGAFEGFPLGSNAVILNRAGAYLSVGPEPNSSDATGAASVAYDTYYEGYLLGPSGDGARIEWNNTTGYLEIRPGEIVTDAELTVKKLVGLIYSVWFLESARLTINTGSNDAGLLANEHARNNTTDDYSFYSKEATSNLITITSGFLDNRFLTTTVGDFDIAAITASGTIDGKNSGTQKTSASGVPGYLVTQ